MDGAAQTADLSHTFHLDGAGKGCQSRYHIRHLELPVFFDTLDRPIELLTQRLGEEALDGDIELLREHDSQAWVNVVLS